MPERWLSVDEIAAHLGVNPDTIYRWITRTSMPAHKVGCLWKFVASVGNTPSPSPQVSMSSLSLSLKVRLTHHGASS